MHSSIAALLLVLVGSIQASQPSRTLPPDASQPHDASAMRRLIVTYSDGRTSSQLLRPRGGFWTARFPRQSQPPLHANLPLSALQVDFEAARDVLVTVSLKYGNPHQKTVRVAAVRLGEEPVRVDDLQSYGVDPIVLSLEAFSPVPLVQPAVASASALLDVTVDLMQHDLPSYKVTFRNRAARDVMAVSFKMFRAQKEVGSGRRKTNRSTPIVDAAGEYTFTLQVGGGETPGFDRFEVDGVLWDNGSVEGNPELQTGEQALAAGYALQLRRVLAILREIAPPGDPTVELQRLAQIRAAIEALPIIPDAADATRATDAASRQSYSTQIGQQQVKEAVLQDIDDYARAHAGGARAPAGPWADQMRPTYAAWLRRAENR